MPKKVALLRNYLDGWFSAQGAYHYKGSLTTPTCNESVEWYVAKEVQRVEKSGIEALRALLNEPSNREV